VVGAFVVKARFKAGVEIEKSFLSTLYFHRFVDWLRLDGGMYCVVKGFICMKVLQFQENLKILIWVQFSLIGQLMVGYR